MGEGLFTTDLFRFLEDLRRHNDRAWFAKNKERYRDVVQEPALEFVRGFAGYLRKISPHFVADDRPVGGSLFRVGRDVHSPSFYLHLQPGETFAAAGVWHPDREALEKIRTAIVAKPDRWKRVAYGQELRSRFHLSGD